MREEELLHHSGWIRRLALDLVGDGSVADDLVQETYLAYLKRRPDRDRPLRPWLAQVLRNQVALLRRGRARRLDREARVARPEGLEPEVELLERAEVGRRLTGHVLQLDEPYRTTVLLRFYEELTPAQIAERRGLPPGTVRSHLHRGLARLRERLERESGGARGEWAVALLPVLRPPLGAVADGGSGAALAGAPAPVSVPVVAAALAGGLAAILLGVLPFAGGRSGDPGAAPSADGARAVADAGGTGGAAAGLAADRGSAAHPSGAGDAGPGTRATGNPPPRRLRLVAEHDGAPLADVPVRLDGEDRRSDADGFLELPPGARAVALRRAAGHGVERMGRHGERVLEPLDAGVATRPVPAPGTDELALATGPAFLLTVVGPPVGSAGRRADALEARLRSLHPGGYRDDGRPWAVAPLEDVAERVAGGTLRVRFAALPTPAPDEPVEWVLEVRDRAGLWFGRAPLGTARRPAGGPVRVEVAPAATLTCWTPDDLSGDLPPLYLLDPEDGPRLLAVHGNGQRRARWVRPGTHELLLDSPLHEPLRVPIELHPGEHHELAVHLTPRAVAGALEGRVTCASGGEAGQLLVFLRATGGEVLGVFPTTWRDEAGVASARFRFDDVPDLDCELQVVSLARALVATGAPHSLRAPREGLELGIDDRAPASDVLLDVRRAEGDRPVEAYVLEVRLAGQPPLRFHRSAEPDPWQLEVGGSLWNRFGGEAPLRALPEDARWTWRVEAEGFPPVQGDQDDVQVSSEGSRRLSVRLGP